MPRLDGAAGRHQATHQVDAVDVHSAQGPPAQVRVVVLGVGLHTAGVVASGAADKENRGSEGPSLLGWKHTAGHIINHSSFWSNNLTLHKPHIPGF